MTKPFKIGLVGTENSHAEGIIEYLNSRRADPLARVVALAGGAAERNRFLSELGGIDMVVDHPNQLLGSVDALIVTTRDGRRHAEQAIPFLEAGVPVWVDKPLAVGLTDATQILDAADRGNAPVVSFSPLRWLPDTNALAEAAEEIGQLQSITVTGPADKTSEYAGLYFYGIHLADVAQRLAPGRSTPVVVRRTPHAIIADYEAGGVAVTLQFVEPEGNSQVPFHAAMVGRHGLIGHNLRLGEGYERPGVDAFTSMLVSRSSPLTRDQMLSPIAVLDEIIALI